MGGVWLDGKASDCTGTAKPARFQAIGSAASDTEASGFGLPSIPRVQDLPPKALIDETIKHRLERS